MNLNFNVKNEWEKAKKQLVRFTKDASVLAKKGEAEVLKISKRSKLQIDSTAVHLKLEHLYYLIGKEFVKQKEDAAFSPAFKKLLAEYETTVRMEKALKHKMMNKVKLIKPSKKSAS